MQPGRAENETNGQKPVAAVSKRARFDPIFSLFYNQVWQENETNGPKSVATVSNQTYFPITSDLADYRHLSRKKLGDVWSTIFKNSPF